MAVKFDYQAVEAGYYDHVFHKRRGPQSKWHWTKFALLSEYVKGGARLLDIGCGPGTFIGYLPDTINATGVDLAQAQVDYANSHYATPYKRFLTVGEARLPFPDGSFDVVSLVELIEHLTLGEIAGLLGEARRLLKPGSGTLIITTPNYRSLWPVMEYFVNRLSALSYEDQHITHFHLGRLRRLLKEAGFQQVRVRRFQGLAPFLAAISWRLSDWFNGMERNSLSRAYGFLLLATARKA